MATEEIDFHLEISRYLRTDHRGGYQAKVLGAPSGGRPDAIFDIDVDDIVNQRDDLENAILAASIPARRAIPVSERSLHEVGTSLFRAVFDGPVNNAYRASLGAAQHQRKRLRLVLSLTAPELAAVPWEMLFDPDDGRYLCRQRPLVRHIPAPDFDPLPLDVEPPLRVLCIVASPRNLGALDTEAEIAQLRAALQEQIEQRRIELVCVPQASWRDVHRHLISGAWHVLHFIGHGDYDPVKTEGCIALVGENGRADMVEASRLTELLDEAEPTPRLVVLNSCSSGRAASDDLFAGTAAALARGGISAVAAMQFTVSDAAAIEFARGFYTAVAEGRDIDRAVLSGRKSILGLPNTLEWVTPVLYIRGGSTRLFHLTDRAHSAPSNPLSQNLRVDPSNPGPTEHFQVPDIVPIPPRNPDPASSIPEPDTALEPGPKPLSEQWADRRARQVDGPSAPSDPDVRPERRSQPAGGQEPIGRQQPIRQPQPSWPPVETPSPETRPEHLVPARAESSETAILDSRPMAPKLLLCLVAAGLAILAAGLMFVNPFVPFVKGFPGQTIYNSDDLRINMIPSMSLALIAGLAGVLTLSPGRARQVGLGLILSGAAVGPWLFFTQWISVGFPSPWSNWDIAVWVWVVGAVAWTIGAIVAGFALLSARVPSQRLRLTFSDRRSQQALLVGGAACIVLLWHYFSMPQEWKETPKISPLLGWIWFAGAALVFPFVASAVRERTLRVGFIVGWAGVSAALLFYQIRELFLRHDDSTVPMVMAIIFGLLVVATVLLFTRTWRDGFTRLEGDRPLPLR